MKEKTIFVFAHWQGMAEPRLVGSLFAQRGRTDEVFKHI